MSKSFRSLFTAGFVAAQGVLGVALIAPAAAVAQTAPVAGENAIERVEATRTAAGVVLNIRLKAPPKGAPASFSIANPARIALDLPDTVNASGSNLFELNQGDLRSVNVVQAQGRSRVVLNLRQSTTHSISVEGNSVIVALGAMSDSTRFGAAPAAAAAASTTVAAAPASAPSAAAAGPRSLRNLDFRRGTEGEGRVVVDLSDPNTTVDIKQQGNSLVVDFINTQLPENLRRRLDVTDFATPVTQVAANQQGNNARLVVTPRGAFEHNAYQSDNRFVLEVKPVKEDPTKLFQGSRQGYQGERLSLNFQNVDVRSLLQVIGDFTNTNIITSDSVGGTITLRLKDVPWDQALDIILQAKGLDMRKNGNVMLIAPRDEIAAREKLELESRNQIADLEPVRSEAFVINYQRAEDVRKLLTDPQQRLLSKRGSATFDPRTNQLFVQDTAARLEEVRRLIARIDVAVPQVLIESRIVEADDRFGRSLGVRFGFGRMTNTGASSGNNIITPGNPAPGGTAGGVGILTPNYVNLPAQAINGFVPGSFALTLFNSALTSILNLEISALEADGRGKEISSPRVVTADKVKALIEQGTEIPYQQATSSGATSVSFRKAVLKLEVTPQITPEGAIFLDVQVNKDSRGEETINGPAINTKSVKTQVLVENGGTVALGGIYQQEDTTTVTGVPYLQELPVVGNLFKTTNTSRARRELLIFITPRIVSERVSGLR
ncbi:MAG TPA: type IV pilus secretin PilQ [Burkholderiaceae bacterium]|nr:type IV pilus secretin PilQ [Burkholderiaceae bacterium]HRZ00118.1 type IV pilus secretin PilQ [Burkholderiaceae bacterium]